jgi:molybdopterin/thiamine biosynthesis adenylyltransferase
VLTSDQIQRWACQVLLPEIGLKGQQRLLEARVLVAGVGALGCGVAAYLVGAGIGRLVLADHDTIELGNLHRQLLYATEDVGAPKVEVAARRLLAMNPALEVRALQEKLDGARTGELAAQVDVVVDCTDSFESRLEINDACLRAGVPLVHGACLGFHGRVMTIVGGHGPCFRCLCPEPPPPEDRQSCSQVGILGPVAGLVASLQAAEVMKLVLAIPEPLVGRMLMVDVQYNEFEILEPAARLDCPACGHPGNGGEGQAVTRG